MPHGPVREDLSPTDKWVTAITDLIELTQKNGIEWKDFNPTIPSQHGLGALGGGHGLGDLGLEGSHTTPLAVYAPEAYQADFGGNILRLEWSGTTTATAVSNPLLSLLSKTLSSPYKLSVHKPSGELLTLFPRIAALNGLMIAVRAQTRGEEDNFLLSLHEAALKSSTQK